MANDTDFSGITVSPAILKLDLATDPDSFILSYQNTSPVTLQLSFSAKDFTGLEEGWRVKFLKPEDAQNFHYSLSSWIDFDTKSLLLKPNETGKLTVKIRKESLSPGGHYASIVADVSPTTPDLGMVALKSQLVSLAFVRANTGFEREEAKVTSFTYDRSGIFSLRFDNTGNTELTPHGLVVVQNFLGKEASRSILNENSLITLPESIRKYEMKSDLSQKPWLLPGKYTAILTVNYARDKAITQSLGFFTLGGQNIQILLFILIVLIVLLLKHTKTRKHQKP